MYHRLHHHLGWWSRVAALVAVVFTLCVSSGITELVPLPAASAHDSVLHSKPEDGSIVAKFPREIVLEFSGIPKPNFNTIAVSDADTHKVLFSKQPKLNKQFVSVTVPDEINPGPGSYLVGFQITSSDGHATRGSVSFSVAKKPEDATTDGEFHDDVASSDASSGPTLGVIVGGIAIVGIIAAVFFLIFKRKER